jgi:uncharacterized protein (TIGR02270 family)
VADAGVNAESEGLVLWDVVLEHLDEAAFGLEELERAFEHPLWSLADVARYPEARLLAHVDGLVVAGDAIVERLLVPAVLEPEDDQPARITAAALALLHLGQRARLAPAFAHEQRAVRMAVVRACTLTIDPELDAWILSEQRKAGEPRARAALLEIAAARGLPPAPLLESLQSDDEELLAAAAVAARRADARTHLPVIEHLVGHPARAVRQAALVPALAWGSRLAWDACRSWALDAITPCPLALTLYAALGGRGEHEQIARLLQSAPHRAPALFALGLSGNPAQVPALLAQLRGADPLRVKTAAQALSMITGIDLGDESLARPDQPAPEAAGEPQEDEDDAASTLPELEDDDLDADLAPAPEAALPELDAEAVERRVQEVASGLASEQRYLAGEPFGPTAALDALERGPQRRRHALALALGIRSGGQVWPNTHAFTTRQRADVAAARALALRSLPSPFAGF